MPDCGIAFGGNLGDSEQYFRRAVTALENRGLQLQAFSTLMKSTPMGSDAGGVFTNAAATFEVTESPQEILRLLHNVENVLGRERHVRWGPRTVDLDLLFCDDLTIDSPELVVPHPCLWFRRFVLQPLAEVAPQWVHPTLRETVEQMCDRLSQRPLILELYDPHQLCPPAGRIHELLAAKFPSQSFEISQTADSDNLSESVFAQIQFVPADASEPRRSQPENTAGRHIRVPAKDASDCKSSIHVVTDILAAAMG